SQILSATFFYSMFSLILKIFPFHEVYPSYPFAIDPPPERMLGRRQPLAQAGRYRHGGAS
ncbi:MAG: hypothetical protein K2I92_03035, partial [Muribaculaceae bacterium]|nr:hypothetical protein [Muribaculaceae bacterium]